MFYQIVIEQCPRQEEENISTLLEDLGALSISLTDNNDDPILEPEPGTTPLWPEVVITALFDDRILAEEAEGLLASKYALKTIRSRLEDEDWVKRGLQDVKPQLFGERLWISPSWESNPSPNMANLILNPGLAFGTGTHPTTRLCLEWLSSHPLSGKTLLDYGCGSGVLGLAALVLGAKQVDAVDIDPQAIIATKDNAKLNNLSNKLRCLEVSKLALEPNYDILISNILLSPLIDLATVFRKLTKPDAFLVLTGVLNEQVETLITHYQDLFKHIKTEQLAEWSLVVFRLY